MVNDVGKKKTAKPEEVYDEDGNVVEPAKKKAEWGDDIRISGADFAQEPRTLISISPSFDIGFGGGIYFGTFCTSAGPPKIGKTVLALQIAAAAQRQVYQLPGEKPCKVFYYDAEARVKARDLRGIRGLDLSPDRFEIIRHRRGKILTAENFIEECEKDINENVRCVHIMDSISMLSTGKERESDAGEQVRSGAPLLMAKFCRRIGPVISVNEAIFIGINHVYANQNATPGSSPWVESGGKVKYAVDAKVMFKYAQPIKEGGDDGAQIGQNVFFKVDSSSIGGPGVSGVGALKFGVGYCCYTELLRICKDLGSCIEGAPVAAGSWWKFPDGQSVQGESKAVKILEETPGLYEKSYQQVRDFYGMPKCEL